MWENSTNFILASICAKVEGAAHLWVAKDRSQHQFSFQELNARSQFSDHFLQQTVQRGSNLCKSLHKVAIIWCQSKEALQFFHVDGCWPFLNAFNLGWICTYSMAWENMSQEGDNLLEELAFLGIELEIGIPWRQFVATEDALQVCPNIKILSR